MDKCLCLLLALTFLQLAFAQKKEGEACSSGSGSAGECKKVSNCPAAQKDAENMRLPMSAVCMFDERDPVVCCPSSNGGEAMRLACEQDASRNRRYGYFHNIVGGIRAEKREFPHMAAVGFSRGTRTLWLCGGTLIHKRFVLTAAHCLEDTSLNRAGKPRFVRLGDLDLKSDEDDVDAQMYDVIKRIAHPEYRQSKQYHDIALLKLGKDVTFDNFVKPACLYTEHNIANPDVIATGWGRGAPVNETGKKLMAVTLQQQPMAKCQEALKMVNSQFLKNALHEGLKEDSMMCVGVDEGGKDTCTGDSGGPIQVKASSAKCHYAVVGLVSFGIGMDCARPGVPAVYTRVSHYVAWIEREVCA